MPEEPFILAGLSAAGHDARRCDSMYVSPLDSGALPSIAHSAVPAKHSKRAQDRAYGGGLETLWRDGYM